MLRGCVHRSRGRLLLRLLPPRLAYRLPALVDVLPGPLVLPQPARWRVSWRVRVHLQPGRPQRRLLLGDQCAGPCKSCESARDLHLQPSGYVLQHQGRRSVWRCRVLRWDVRTDPARERGRKMSVAAPVNPALDRSSEGGRMAVPPCVRSQPAAIGSASSLVQRSVTGCCVPHQRPLRFLRPARIPPRRRNGDAAAVSLVVGPRGAHRHRRNRRPRRLRGY